MIFGFYHYLAFTIAVLFFLVLDLGVFNRKAHVVGFREALAWSIGWVAVSLLFNALIFHHYGSKLGREFLAGYLIEKALSVDNIFVFLMVFTFFQVKQKYQYRVLFWGVLGALVFRGIMIGAGVALISRFEWLLTVFGAFLVYTGLKMAVHKDEPIDIAENRVVKLCRRWLRISQNDHGQKFLVRENDRLCLTPLFVVLLVVETTDIVFAFDSIPAIFGVTREPFIVYSSNIFAILGLRSLYFLLAGVMEMFRYLKIGLSVLLVFIGAKMLAEHILHFHVSIGISLLTIALILAASIVASILAARREAEQPPSPASGEAASEQETDAN